MGRSPSRSRLKAIYLYLRRLLAIYVWLWLEHSNCGLLLANTLAHRDPCHSPSRTVSYCLGPYFGHSQRNIRYIPNAVSSSVFLFTHLPLCSHSWNDMSERLHWQYVSSSTPMLLVRCPVTLQLRMEHQTFSLSFYCYLNTSSKNCKKLNYLLFQWGTALIFRFRKEYRRFIY